MFSMCLKEKKLKKWICFQDFDNCYLLCMLKKKLKYAYVYKQNTPKYVN